MSKQSKHSKSARRYISHLTAEERREKYTPKKLKKNQGTPSGLSVYVTEGANCRATGNDAASATIRCSHCDTSGIAVPPVFAEKILQLEENLKIVSDSAHGFSDSLILSQKRILELESIIVKLAGKL